MQSHPRNGCRDIWNASMCRGARYTEHDIPICPTTAKTPPKAIVAWDEAKHIHKEAVKNKEPDYSNDAFVCFYLDDYKFDGPGGIWNDKDAALEVIRHFAGAITPDFSTYQDFPAPIKYYNTYRMRAFGYWLGAHGIAVINNVRWGTQETWWYCWDGIDRNSIVAIGTVGGSPRKLADRERFEEGLTEMVRVLAPTVIVVYGSANYPCFEKLRRDGVTIISFPGQTALAFERRRLK